MEQLKGWRGLLIKAALLLVTVFLALVSPRFIPFITTSENWASDWRISLFNPSEEPHEDIVILAITEDTLARFPYRFPVDRDFLANLIETLNAKGARLIALDILFDQSTEKEKDDRLRHLLETSEVPVVVGWTDQETGLTEAQYAYQKDYLANAHHGFSNLLKDPDGTVRFGVPTVKSEGRAEVSFSGRMASILGIDLPKEKVRLAYRGRPDGGKPVFPKYPSHAISKHFPEAWLKGKIILVGADLPFEDRHRTPFAAELGLSMGRVPGVEVQAHMLAQFVEGEIKDTET
ncbi:MAG: CHASE2 domain-containing protein [Rhodospirillaceae bacterium]|nr:CHASE2 domain-containing protein [Rhodospirillaceae bacterium]